MRIKELSERSGVSVATIKYYLREGLLEPGEATAANQADYDERHLDRLLLIRALREGGNLSIAALRNVFEAMARYRQGRPEYLAIAVRSLTDGGEGDAGDPDSRALVDGLVERLGWDVDPDSPGREDLVRAVGAVQRFLPGLVTSPRALVPHALAVRGLADVEIPDSYDPARDPAATLRFAVLGTVLFEPVILALRKLAHVDRQRSLARDRDA